MKKRGAGHILESTSVEDELDILPATQEDVVSWETGTSHLAFANKDKVEIPEEEDSIDFAHSFTWQEIFKTKKQRLSASLETQENFQSLFAHLSDSPEKDTNNYEYSKLGSTSSHVSIVLPLPNEVVGVQSQTHTLDDIDFMISEEELKKIDEEVNKKYMEAPTERQIQKQATVETTIPDFSSIDNFQFETIEVSNEYMALFDALEQQAYISTQAPVQSPSVEIATTNNSGNLYGLAIPINNPPVLPTTNTIPMYRDTTTNHNMLLQQVPQVHVKDDITSQLKSNGSFALSPNIVTSAAAITLGHNFKVDNDSLFCIRLRAIEVREDVRLHKKVIISQLDESIFPTNKLNSAQNEFGQIFVELEHTWFDSIISNGDIFHVIDVNGESVIDPNKHSSIVKSWNPLIINISDSCGIIIVAPDILISPTKIAESCTCIRRGVLTDRMRSFGSTTSAAIMGNVRHMFIENLTERILMIVQEIKTEYLIQEGNIMQKLQENQYIDSLVQLCIQEHLDELFSLTIKDEEIQRDLRSIIPPLIKWVITAVKVGANQLVKQFSIDGEGGGGNPLLQSLFSTNQDCKFQEVIGIEETIHSPMLGIKGQVDMIMGGKLLVQQQKTPASSFSALQDLILPIELKTGMWKHSSAIAHRAQVILYILLMLLRERTSSINITHVMNEVATYGLLVYINQQELKVDLILPSWLEIRALLLSRNQLAKQIQDSMENTAGKVLLPPILNLTNTCSYCYSASECMLYHSAIEDGNAISTSNITTLYQYILRGINARHLQYFKQWDRLIDLEYLASQKSVTQKLLWRRYDWEEEENDRNNQKSLNYLCIAEMTKLGSEQLKVKLQRIKLPERKQQSLTGSKGIGQKGDFCSSSLMIGDRVQISLLKCSDKDHSDSSSSSHKVLLKKRKAFSKNIFSNRSTTKQLAITATFSLATNHAANIHDASSTFSGDSSIPVMTTVHANICSGSIQSITNDEIELFVSNGARALTTLQTQLRNQNINSLEEIGWCIRIDKDEINVNISTMRSNLMELFVEPFSPKIFSDATNPKRKTSAASDLTNTVDDLTSRIMYMNSSIRQKIRDLVVDLRPPVFQPLPIYTRPTTVATAFSYPTTPSIAVEDMIAGISCLRDHFNDLWLLWTPIQLTKDMYLKTLSILRQYILNYTNQKMVQNLSHLVHLDTITFPGMIHFPQQYIIYPGCYPWILYQEYFQFNPEQQECIHKVLATQDFALIWGLPGSGKTSLLSYIIRILIARNEKILLTSYTHNAVDHLLQKLIEKGVNLETVMRLTSQSQKVSLSMTRADSAASIMSNHGREEWVDTSNEDPSLCTTPSSTSFPTLQSYRDHVSHICLFVSTILTVSRHALFKTMKVDWCIIDEAGQLLQPVILGGILKSKKFILVGDDYQLPPLVLSKDAIAQGMDISLFKRLIDIHPHAMCSLTAQYRMNDVIMSLCNTLVYENRMTCGSPTVANARLPLPSLHRLPLPMETLGHARVGSSTTMMTGLNNRNLYPPKIPRHDWLYITLLPTNPVVFLNTDTIPQNALQHLEHLINNNKNNVGHAPSSSSTISSTSNHVDAYIVQLLLWGFEQCQLPQSNDLAIITPFRAQVQLLQQWINQGENPGIRMNAKTAKLPLPNTRDYEISTIDKYQGKDRDIIILNTVKKMKVADANINTNVPDGTKNTANAAGYLLKDWRRINVALTRAKLKLIIIGSIKIMHEEPILQSLAKFVTDKQWVIDLPPHACSMYPSSSSLHTVPTKHY